MPDDVGHDLLSNSPQNGVRRCSWLQQGAAAPFAILRAYFILAIAIWRGLQERAWLTDYVKEG
jgi:hypothetical protein